ncbi:MAG: fluoride efflux transporter CrcB [Usitatibacter sp.]
MTNISGWSVVAVGAGAAAGAWIRWILGMLLNPIFPTIPLGTVAANIAGGFLMGVSMALMTHFEAMPPQLRLLMTTGFLGGLTTFSTFSAETATLISRGQHEWAAAIVLVHVAGSVAATFAGIALAEVLLFGGSR